MKRNLTIVGVIVVLVLSAWAQDKPAQPKAPPVPAEIALAVRTAQLKTANLELQLRQFIESYNRANEATKQELQDAVAAAEKAAPEGYTFDANSVSYVKKTVKPTAPKQ